LIAGLKGNPYLIGSDENVSSTANTTGSNTSSSTGSPTTGVSGGNRRGCNNDRRNNETKIKRDLHEEISVERGGEPTFRRTRDVHRETVVYDGGDDDDVVVDTRYIINDTSPAYHVGGTRNPAYDG
jgi:hypothetical protein